MVLESKNASFTWNRGRRLNIISIEIQVNNYLGRLLKVLHGTKNSADFVKKLLAYTFMKDGT